MSVPCGNVIVERKVKLMNKTPMDLATLQAKYDAMVAIAMATLDADLDLDPKFERELTALMRVVKSMGGNAR
jgi:hypothetical protein